MSGRAAENSPSIISLEVESVERIVPETSTPLVGGTKDQGVVAVANIF